MYEWVCTLKPKKTGMSIKVTVSARSSNEARTIVSSQYKDHTLIGIPSKKN